MTVSQLLKDEEYLSEFLKNAFAATPSLLATTRIDQEMVLLA
jgi:hypothetical protein